VHKRIYSLLTVGGVLSGTLYVVACGGSSGKSPDAGVKLKDSSNTQMDAPAAVCALSSADLMALMGGISVGSAGSAVPMTADGSGGTGGSDLEAGLVITGFSDPAVGIYFNFEDNAGVFTAAEAGKFTTPPKAGTYNQDPDGSWGAGFDIVNGITDNGDGTVTIMPTQAYLVGTETTAQFVITTWSGSAKAGGTSTLNVEFKNSTMDGGTVDGSGNITPDGCSAVVSDFAMPDDVITWPSPLPTGSIRPMVAKQQSIANLRGKRFRAVSLSSLQHN
jgi:hypothetical protein